MNGQWAVAIWDSAARRLVLSRDRTGICPLHFCEHKGRLYFASEVKAIFAADPAIPRHSIRPGSMQTFTFWTVVPPQGIFHGIEELPPGHFRIYENGGVREGAFWKPRYPDAAARRAFKGTSTTPSRRCETRWNPQHRFGWCAPTCRSAAISPAGSTARSSRRWDARFGRAFPHILAALR